jgi:membrane protein DedA with SNARE-associated domain
MEWFFTFICQHAHEAHWIIFILIMLAGINIPISEDLMIITGGALASTCVPEHTFRMFVWVYAACYLSAWEAYWVGRLLGPKLFRIRWFSHILNPNRLEKLRYYYEKFGIFTFIVGRFVPGGVRNALFMSSGLSRMPFLLFIFRDGIASLISTSVIFFIGYHFGQNLPLIAHYFKKYEEWAIGIIILLIVSIGGIIWLKKNSKKKPLARNNENN